MNDEQIAEPEVEAPAIEQEVPVPEPRIIGDPVEGQENTFASGPDDTMAEGSHYWPTPAKGGPAELFLKQNGQWKKIRPEDLG